MTLSVHSHLPLHARRTALEADVRAGLSGEPKWLSPVWFYDERGSRLFDEITRLPEYYLTRAERSILEADASAIVAAADCDTLIELGSGSSEKTRRLLDAMADLDSLAHYVPLDVSEEILLSSAQEIHESYDVDVTAVVADFASQLDLVPSDGRRLFTFLGSTIGNFDPSSRGRFLADLASSMAPNDRFLLGTDLFEHRAIWDEENSWIAMHLVARTSHVVTIPSVGLQVHFSAGEPLRTEISTKFRTEQLGNELEAAGLVTEAIWNDVAGDFQLALARRANPSLAERE